MCVCVLDVFMHCRHFTVCVCVCVSVCVCVCWTSSCIVDTSLCVCVCECVSQHTLTPMIPSKDLMHDCGCLGMWVQFSWVTMETTLL